VSNVRKAIRALCATCSMQHTHPKTPFTP